MKGNTAQIAYEAQRKNGWSDEELLEAILTYVENQDSDDAFRDFLMNG